MSTKDIPLPAKKPSFADLQVANDFLSARDLPPVTDADLLSAAELLPAVSGNDAPEQMANAQIWLATKTPAGIANANLNLKLIGCKPVDLEY